jgi:hypothetical protein
LVLSISINEVVVQRFDETARKAAAEWAARWRRRVGEGRVCGRQEVMTVAGDGSESIWDSYPVGEDAVVVVIVMALGRVRVEESKRMRLEGVERVSVKGLRVVVETE